MMRELADNILDIAQNSIAAGASLVEIDISVSRAQDTVSLAFIDDGCGMSEDMVKAVYTSSTAMSSRNTPSVQIRNKEVKLCFVPMFWSAAVRADRLLRPVRGPGR